MVSLLSQAIDVYSNPYVIVWRMFMDVPMSGWKVYPESGWPVYDVHSMKVHNISGRDELFAKIIGDVKVQGFTVNKAVRKDITEGLRFDETLIYGEDEIYCLRVLERNETLKVCYLDNYLYCYVQHQKTGLLRDPVNYYDEEGITNFMPAVERMLAMKNLPPSAAKIVKARLYFTALQNLFRNTVSLTPRAYGKLRKYVHEYAMNYYLSSYHTLFVKAKSFVKHILLLLRNHQPRRK